MIKSSSLSQANDQPEAKARLLYFQYRSQVKWRASQNTPSTRCAVYPLIFWNRWTIRFLCGEYRKGLTLPLWSLPIWQCPELTVTILLIRNRFLTFNYCSTRNRDLNLKKCTLGLFLKYPLSFYSFNFESQKSQTKRGLYIQKMISFSIRISSLNSS